MRLLVDADVSARRIVRRLRDAGHDVVALGENPELSALGDAEVLELATSEHRIVVTHSGRDFVPLLRTCGEAQRVHTGCILIWSLRHDEFSRIAAAVGALLADRPRQDAWRNIALSV